MLARVACWRPAGLLGTAEGTAEDTHRAAHCIRIKSSVREGVGRHAQIVVGLLRSAIEAVVHGGDAVLRLYRGAGADVQYLR